MSKLFCLVAKVKPLVANPQLKNSHFDKVPHRRLLYKLDYYGIRGSTHKWITSWLSERFQKVVLDGQASDPVPVLSGVPQGSVLGQVLFLIFINDLPENMRSSVRLFADDCVLYRNIESLMDCQILQDDLDSLAHNPSLL